MYVCTCMYIHVHRDIYIYRQPLKTGMKHITPTHPHTVKFDIGYYVQDLNYICMYMIYVHTVIHTTYVHDVRMYMMYVYSTYSHTYYIFSNSGDILL